VASSPRASRTVIGHEFHLPAQPIHRPAASAPPSPGAATSSGVPQAVVDENTEKLAPRARHTGKSRFPAIARLFGRWTTGGSFRSQSHTFDNDDELPELPRNVWPSRVAIFVGAALLSFLLVLAVLKLHR